MPVNIELSALTSGGIKEVRADWTRTAEKFISAALKHQLAQHDDKLVDYVEPLNPREVHEHSQIFKLHAVVGKTIFKLGFPCHCTHNQEKFVRMVIGKEVSSIRNASGALW